MSCEKHRDDKWWIFGGEFEIKVEFLWEKKPKKMKTKKIVKAKQKIKAWIVTGKKENLQISLLQNMNLSVEMFTCVDLQQLDLIITFFFY